MYGRGFQQDGIMGITFMPTMAIMPVMATMVKEADMLFMLFLG